MSFKPGDFFIGVIDFFSVILPGAVLTMYLAHINVFTCITVTTLTNGAGMNWLIFGLASYFFGHLLFVSSSVLDRFYDRFYIRRKLVSDDFLDDKSQVGWIRYLFRNYYAIRAPKTVKEGTFWSRAFEDSDLTKCAESYKMADFEEEDHQPPSESARMKSSKRKDERITNLFKWASINVTINDPNAASEITRLQADSKFFRSATGLIILVSIVDVLTPSIVTLCDLDLQPLRLVHTIPSFVLTASAILLTLYRYMDLRKKAVDLCYGYYIALRKRDGAGSSP